MLSVPGDAMISHLALAAAAVARGESVIAGAPGTPGLAASARALAALGARVERRGELWQVSGLGASGLLEPAAPLDFRESGLGLQLMMGLAGVYDFPTTFLGTPEVSGRATAQLLSRLGAFGVRLAGEDAARLSQTLHGPGLPMPVEMTLPAHAPVMKAALLLAAMAAPCVSRFTEPMPTWNHAERMLAQFGAGLTVTPDDAGGRRIELAGLADLRARQVAIPANTGFAALGAVAATIVPGSEIRIENVLVNPARTAILAALVALGANIEVSQLRSAGGEEVADLTVKHAGLRGVTLGAPHVEPLLGDMPMLAVAAAFAEGETVLNMPPGLPLLEQARLMAIARGLAANGVEAEADDEMFAIRGVGQVRGGGRVVTTGDPMIGMAFLVLGMAAGDQVTIDNQSGIEEHFPGFIDRFENIGASFVRYTE